MASEFAGGMTAWPSVGCPSTCMKIASICSISWVRTAAPEGTMLYTVLQTPSRTLKSKDWMTHLKTVLVNGEKIRAALKNEDVLEFFQKKADEHLTQL